MLTASVSAEQSHLSFMVEQTIELVENESLYRERTMEYREVDLSVGPVEYVDVGVGEPVVFLQGFMANPELWRKVIPPLSERYRCIAPVLPMGAHHRPMDADADLSPNGLVEILFELLDRIGVDQASIVGTDAGGAIGELVVANYPERVTRLVLTNCDAYEAFPPRLFRHLQYASYVPGFTRFMAFALGFRIVRRLPLTYGWTTLEPLPSEIVDVFVQEFTANPAIRRDTRKMLQEVKPEYTLEASGEFPRYSEPVLVMWARRDPIFPERHAEQLAAAFPDSRLEYIEDSGVFVPEDQPRVLVRRIEEFLDDTEPVDSNVQESHELPTIS